MSNAAKYTVGDAVHYSFNGDSYSANVIEVSASGHQIRVQDLGRVQGVYTFTRRANGAYRSKGTGTWTLHHGHYEARNPSF